jgi:NTP pyrophosphatase (non-canonical NTP hydrolase)
MEEKLKQIINHYGVIPQLKYFQSEVFELNEAIIQREYPALAINKKPSELALYEKNHIAEEIADVQVMLNQFRLYYGITDEEVKNIMIKKIDRQLERIKGEIC